jgi:hypothetical protein
MKIVPPKQSPTPTKKNPLLPLVPDPLDEMKSENSVSFNLRTDPTDRNSSTYKKYVRVLSGSETIRTILKWAEDAAQVLLGLNVTDPKVSYTMMYNMMEGSAQANFSLKVNAACTALMDEAIAAATDAAARKAAKDAGWKSYMTAEIIVESKAQVVSSMIPHKIVAMVKRYLRRECRKPADMKVRTYYQHLLRINEHELPILPPYKVGQSMNDDEIVDILCYGTPKSWSREMDRQGFDPVAKTPEQVVDFLERIEQSEDFDGQRVDHSQKSNGNNNNNKKKGSPSSNKSGTKYCLIHGKGNHSSDECNKLQEQAKRLKTNDGKASGTGKHNNKSWTRQANSSNNQGKKDLAAFIKKQVAKGVQKELNSADKKRKASSSDDELDMHAFGGDLKGFNYEDMDNLKIDTDDEISV